MILAFEFEEATGGTKMEAGKPLGAITVTQMREDSGPDENVHNGSGEEWCDSDVFLR